MPVDSKNKTAILTYVCNDLFVNGAASLLLSLRTNSPNAFLKRSMVCMCLEEVTQNSKNFLASLGFQIISLTKNEYLFSERSDFTDRYSHKSWMMFTKLKIFSLYQFDQILYLDADTYVRKEIDSLFEINSSLAAFFDNDCLDPANRGLNGGVLLLRPRPDTYAKIISNINTWFEGGHTDQSLLNGIMSETYHLPREFNTLDKFTSRSKRYIRAVIASKSKIYHFNGPKPWILFSKSYGWRAGMSRAFLEYCLILVWALKSNPTRCILAIIVIATNILSSFLFTSYSYYISLRTKN